MTEAVANSTPESAVSPQPRDIHSSSPPPNWQRGFWALIVTQFQNAFNDNAIKFLVIYIIVAMNFPGEPARFPGAGRRRAVRAAIYFLLDDGRLFCRPLQQAQRGDWHEADGNCCDGCRDCRPRDAESCRLSARQFFDQHAICAFWPFEVWFAAGACSRSESCRGGTESSSLAHFSEAFRL